MKKVIWGCLLLVMGFILVDCGSMSKEGMYKKYYEAATEPVIADTVCQGFIDAVNAMADGLLSAPAIANASKPPLVVIHSLNNDSTKKFNIPKYIDAEREILIKQGGTKVRFIDKETEEKADYYLLSTIADIDSEGKIRSNKHSQLCSLDNQSSELLVAQKSSEYEEAESDYKTISRTYQLTIKLVNPESGNLAWKETKEFKRKELQPTRPRAPMFRAK